MNVYFVNPTYVKPEGWKPLLTYLKVKAAFSFIPKEELPESLYSIIKSYLKASYSNQDMKKFSDNCAYWLRAHFEKHIHLITDDFGDVNNIPKEERIKYSSPSAFNNLKYLDEENCLILLKLESHFDYEGTIKAPVFYVDGLQDRNLPTHITRYCLNILHKKYGHYQFHNQSSFITFSEYFSSAYRFEHRYKSWNPYMLSSTNGRSIGFMNHVNRVIWELAPNDFPLIDDNGKKSFTQLRTEEGEENFKKLMNNAKEAEERYQEENSWKEDLGPSDQEVAEELTRDFWKECGEGGSNCESWPGWG